MSSLKIGNDEIIVEGEFVKIARHKEEWYQDIHDPQKLIEKIIKSAREIDIFTFWQRLPEINPKYGYYMEWDNIAAVRIDSYEHWIKKQINRKARQAVNRALRRGITTCIVDLDDTLIEGITDIYKETPIRQGRIFRHYNYNSDDVKRTMISYLEQSTFIGAYYNNELVGFLKIVFDKNVGCLMYIITKNKYRDKCPTNALLSKAVEVCVQKGAKHLIYGNYIYGNKTKDNLIDFKRHNGFEKIELPRYYVSLTMKGRIALWLGVRKKLSDMFHESIVINLSKLRKKLYRYKGIQRILR